MCNLDLESKDLNFEHYGMFKSYSNKVVHTLLLSTRKLLNIVLCSQRSPGKLCD